MTKKKYITPNMEVIVMKVRSSMLIQSNLDDEDSNNITEENQFI